MSVVAWDGRRLSADTFCCYGNLVRTESKVFKINEDLYMGCVGNLADGYKVKAWLEDPGMVPKPEKLENSTCMIVRRGKTEVTVTLLEENMIEVPMSSRKYAIGSGKDIVMGAMLAGYSSKDSIELVAYYHAELSTPVDSFLIEPIENDIPF